MNPVEVHWPSRRTWPTIWPKRGSHPLACRGLLTQGDPRPCQPEAGRQRGHFLPAPWRMARLRLEAVWEEEKRQYGFLVLGELVTLLYLLLSGFPQEREEAEALL